MDASRWTPIPHKSLNVELCRCSNADCDLLSDYCDSILGRDYFFKRRHLLSILERPTNAVFCVTIDRHMAGLVIVYKSCVLDNLYISPEYRETGVGSAVLQFLRPQRIRSKTNMLAGDPTPFYERNGYVVDQPDPERPHIKDMVLPPGSTPPSSRTAPPHTSGNGAVPPELRTAGLNLDRPANGRAVGGPTAVQPHSPLLNGIVPPTPPVTPAGGGGRAVILPNGMVALPAEEYARFKSQADTRDRVRKYRAKRKAEAAAVEAAAAVVTSAEGAATGNAEWLRQFVQLGAE